MNKQIVQRPNYLREDITVGIAHFGVGNFHRAHQAIYMHELFERGIALDWGICGIGVLPGDARMRDALSSQMFTYTHIARRSNGEAIARQVGSIVDYLFAPDDPEAVLRLLAEPTTRIVSFTITEGGYNTDPVTGRFDAQNPDVISDLQPGAVPSTVFGIVTKALAIRRQRGISPFTVMSCDNLQGNGDVARRSLVAFAALSDPEFGEWIAENVCFPNSMVDRITPATSDSDREFVGREFGAKDPWPVVSEEFLQWVLEDSFSLGRPPLELVGVDVVRDVVPFERMKLRVLNASHQVLAYFGLLLGFELVDEAARDPLISRLIERFMEEEAIPTLFPTHEIDPADYGRTATERFRNPHTRDTLLRIATDASDRIATFLLPIAVDAAAAQRTTPIVAAVVASWAHYCADVAPKTGGADRQQPAIDAALAAQRETPAGFLGERRLFGDFEDSKQFKEMFQLMFDLISALGVRRALEALVEDQIDWTSAQ